MERLTVNDLNKVGCMIECFGISVFPTKEQAEEALKKMEDNNE